MAKFLWKLFLKEISLKEVEQHRELAEYLLQCEERRPCAQVHHLQTASIIGQVIRMTMTMTMTMTMKSRFFIHDVSPTEAALTKLENAFVLIGLNR